MKFLVDAQLPPSLAAWLRTKGHEASHVQDVALRDSEDTDIRRHAEANGSIIVTKDRDFVAPSHALRVIWVRTGNIPTRVLFERFEANWTSIEAYLEQGYAVVEVR